jgi:hypothetical protein
VRSNSWADALEPAFVGLTEGIWIAVLYLLVEIVGRTPTTINPVVFVVVAGLSALAGARLDRLGAARWQVVSLAAVVVGAIGTLVGPGVLSTLLAGDVGAAFSAHPGGWLLGLAAFRGMIGAGGLDDPDRASRPFVRGIIALTLMWLYAGLLDSGSQLAFRSAAIGPTLVYATAGVGAIGLRRVHAVAVPAGIEWWRNRTWMVVLALLVTVLALLAIPVGSQLAIAIPGILGLAGFPEVFLFVLFVAWLVAPRRPRRRPGRSTLRGFLGLAIFLAIGAIAYQLLHSNVNQTASGSGAARPGFSTTSNGVLGVAIVVGVLLAIAVFAILLARNWHGRGPVPALGPVDDDSGYEVVGPGLGWLRRARNRLFGERTPRRPGNAEAAYIATLGLLEPLRDLRRLPHETPQAHARRIREAGSGTLELDLLAADYELSRWGARTLAGRETQRAISRWDRSRGWIAARILAEEAARRHAEEHEGRNEP